MSPSDFDNGQEDVNMMNIPREGNAEQLNKSVKLTLSSKKQYDNHLKNVPINSGLNKTPNLNDRNQYKGNYGQQVQGANGIVTINNIYGNDVARNKMNSTMMVQMNNQTEQLKNSRGNMNKSTLLPNNTGPNMAMTLTQSRNIQTKMNNIPGTRNDGSGFMEQQQNSNNMGHSSFEHLKPNNHMPF